MMENQFEKKITSPVLVACADTRINQQLRGALQELNFVNVAGVFSFDDALTKAAGAVFDYVFFDNAAGNIAPHEFVEKILEINEDCGLIAVADKLNMDELFSLLRAGARSFLIFPFTFDAVEQSIKHAGLLQDIDEEVLNDPDRGSVLTEVALNNLNLLYRLLVLEGNAQNSPKFYELVNQRRRSFVESIELAKASIPGGEEAFLELVVEKCLERAMMAPTRLGKLRKRLRQERHAAGGAPSTEGEES